MTYSTAPFLPVGVSHCCSLLTTVLMPFSILQASPSSVPTSVESTITGRLAHFTTSKIPIPNEARPKIEVIDVRIRSGNR
jgi:hypothetical protein